MTTVTRVSLAEMINETGIPALGYSRPQDDEILLVDGLPKAQEREVLAHEAEHISKGEEGPFLKKLVSAAAPIVGGILGGAPGAAIGSMVGGAVAGKPKAAGGAYQPAESNLMLGIANAMSDLQAPGANRVNPRDLNRRITSTPGYRFMSDEANKSILNNASALGLRQSGATAKDVADYTAKSIAMPAYQDYMGRLANLAGTGEVAANVGRGAMTGFGNIGAGNATGQLNAGNASAAGTMGQAGAWSNTMRSLADLYGDWKGAQSGPYTPAGGNFRQGDQFMPPTN